MSQPRLPAIRAAGAKSRSWPVWKFRIVFFAIVALAAFLRFWRIGHQYFWTDESITALRVSGTFGQMVKSLNGQGFPPGWYTLLWLWIRVLRRALFLGPTASVSIPALRALTAFFGVAAVPCAYYLARQFMARRGALLAMLFTAVNPFLIYYSRDIKMYMPLYCLLFLQLALLLAWLRRPRGASRWALLVLTLFATQSVVLIDSLAWIVILLEFVLLIGRVKADEVSPFLVGVVACAILPWYWYRYRTPWWKTLSKQHGWGGLGWIKKHVVMNVHTVVSLPCVQLLGFIWPRTKPGKVFKHAAFLPRVAKVEHWLILLLIAVMVIGLVPWRRLFRRARPRRRGGPFWFVALWILAPTVLAILISSQKKDWWSLYPHRVLWQPRYLGIVAPAFILWLAAAVMRLPGKFVRRCVGSVFVIAMTASGLCNQLIYHETPWQLIIKTMGPYIRHGNNPHLRVVSTGILYPWPSWPYAVLMRQRRVPSWSNATAKAKVYVPGIWYIPDQTPNWLHAFTVAGKDHLVRHLLTITKLRSNGANLFKQKPLRALIAKSWKLQRAAKFVLYRQWQYTRYQRWRIYLWRRKR